MYARMLVCVWRGASGGGITHPTQSIVGRRESGRRGEEGEGTTHFDMNFKPCY